MDTHEHEGRSAQNRMKGGDTGRIGSLINRGESSAYKRNDSREEADSSIPLPSLDEKGRTEGDELWNASGAMTLEDYQRLRKGYERGINPEALEQIEGAQRDVPKERAVPGDPSPERIPPLRIRPEIWSPQSERVTMKVDESEKKRRIGPLGMTAILLVGIFGALILYAGSVAYITGLFSSEEPLIEENLTLVTDRPQLETEIDSDESLTPGEKMELSDQVEEEAGEAEENLNDEVEELSEEDVGFVNEEQEEKQEKKTEPEAAEREPDERTSATPSELVDKGDELKEGVDRTTVLSSEKENDGSSTTERAIKPFSSSTKYTIQVGATPDKSEADRLAARVRSKGGSNVKVITTKKSGETLYRIRFGSFESQDEAKSKASAMGFRDVWVVKK